MERVMRHGGFFCQMSMTQIWLELAVQLFWHRSPALLCLTLGWLWCCFYFLWCLKQSNGLLYMLLVRWRGMKGFAILCQVMVEPSLHVVLLSTSVASGSLQSCIHSVSGFKIWKLIWHLMYWVSCLQQSSGSSFFLAKSVYSSFCVQVRWRWRDLRLID